MVEKKECSKRRIKGSIHCQKVGVIRIKEGEDIISEKELANTLQLCGALLQNLELSETKRRRQVGIGPSGKVVVGGGKRQEIVNSHQLWEE